MDNSNSSSNIEQLIDEMKTETLNVAGDEFGLFDYNNLDKETREQKWMILSYIIDMGKILPEDVGIMFERNPFFYDWYKRTVISEEPVGETYH